MKYLLIDISVKDEHRAMEWCEQHFGFPKGTLDEWNEECWFTCRVFIPMVNVAPGSFGRKRIVRRFYFADSEHALLFKIAWGGTAM